MPQLEFADFAPQLVWLAISFVLLYVAMARVALPRVSRILEERQMQISDDLSRAEKLRAEAEDVMTAYNTAVAKARAAAQAEMQRASEAVASVIQQREGEFLKGLQARTQDAEQAIHSARAKALAEIDGMAADLAGQIVQRLTGAAADPSQAAAAVAASAKNLATEPA